jgi:transposase-like protein
MYPVAFGLIQSEPEDNWVWFMKQLCRAIGDMPQLAICTDACKGLEKAVVQVFPYVDQRECFRHLMQNFIKSIYSRMYPAVEAYKKDKFQYHMTQMFSGSNDVFKYLDELQPRN